MAENLPGQRKYDRAGAAEDRIRWRLTSRSIAMFHAGTRAVGRAVGLFSSVDSAPKAFSVSRPRAVADGFLIGFTALTLLALSALVYTERALGIDIPRDLVFYTADRHSSVLPIRTFFLLFFILYALYAFGSFAAKLRLGGTLLLKLLVVCLAVDAMALLSWEGAGVVWPIYVQQLLAGLAALAVFPHTVLSQARLPAASGIPVKRRGKIFEWGLLGLTVLIAVVAALVFEHLYAEEVSFLRAVALLGGLGPGVFLVQQAISVQLAGIGFVRNWLSRRRDFSAPVAVLIPAHNEAHRIAATLAAIDAAAKRYDGPVMIYLVENGSVDATAEVAEQALEAMRYATGQVLYCTALGKAKALNYGLARIREEFVIRVDADTLLQPTAIRTAMRHFANKNVGAVGGIPYPYHGSGLIGRLRMIEVLMRHGFYQPALGAINGILGVPGMFTAFRRNAIEEAGGIAEEMNGEDTDVVLRMSYAGYRVVSDPGVRYNSEVPETLAHLREQRTRWFRSVYHIASHNRETIFRFRTITGNAILPFTLMNATRRAMLAPLGIYSLIVIVLFGGYYTHPDLPALIALVVGMPFVMTVLVCLLWLRLDLLPFVPFYLGFRFLRSYYTLGAALTLIYPEAEQRRREAPKPFARAARETAPAE